VGFRSFTILSWLTVDEPISPHLDELLGPIRSDGQAE
jgi:hypothetical protein